MTDAAKDAVARAALTLGSSDPAIIESVASVVRAEAARSRTLVDVGCGTGSLGRALAGAFERYVGCDLVAYEGFPREPWASFVQADLDRPPWPVPDATADVVAAVETIEHLENPRAFVRELARIAAPGALVLVTTPNQLSLLSKMTFLVKDQFNAFQESSYPAHRTALLGVDLVRIAREAGLEDPRLVYAAGGRIPFTGRHWPRWLRGRRWSDSVLLRARKP